MITLKNAVLNILAIEEKIKKVKKSEYSVMDGIPSEEYIRLETEYDDVMSSYLAYPHIAPYIRHTIIEVVHNNVSEDAKKEFDQLLEQKLGKIESPEQMQNLSEKDVEDILTQYGGSLRSEVKKSLEENEYHITDSGGGDMGWSLGVHCTDSEATEVSFIIHTKFRKAIDSNLLKVYRKEYVKTFIDELFEVEEDDEESDDSDKK